MYGFLKETVRGGVVYSNELHILFGGNPDFGFQGLGTGLVQVVSDSPR